MKCVCAVQSVCHYVSRLCKVTSSHNVYQLIVMLYYCFDLVYNVSQSVSTANMCVVLCICQSFSTGVHSIDRNCDIINQRKVITCQCFVLICI